MFKKIEYFLPTYKQCWIIVFFICVVGSVTVTAILSAVNKLSGYGIEDINSLIKYILPMVPPFLYILLKGKEVEDTNRLAEQKGLVQYIKKAVPLDKTNIGQANIIIFILLCILTPIAIGIVSEPLTSWIEMPENFKKIFESLMEKSTWAFITAVIAAPIIEEFFLRGVMARGMFFHSTQAKAILWSAFFFAVIHMNPWQAVPAFIIGIFLGWIYWRTHSLLACIFIHFANNGLAFLVSFLYPDIAVDATTREVLSNLGSNIYPIIYVTSLIILVISFYYLNKKLPVTGFDTVTDKQNLKYE